MQRVVAFRSLTLCLCGALCSSCTGQGSAPVQQAVASTALGGCSLKPRRPGHRATPRCPRRPQPLALRRQHGNASSSQLRPWLVLLYTPFAGQLEKSVNKWIAGYFGKVWQTRIRIRCLRASMPRSTSSTSTTFQLRKWRSVLVNQEMRRGCDALHTDQTRSLHSKTEG